MEYQVLARKYRPRVFADMVGQEHVARTLQNALTRGRTGHAYLFVGTRGIGKTTVARIFAKALNCARAPTPEPCCECENCLAISRGSCLDVVEIDGASNNSVDNIRGLRDEVGHAPASCRYKVYIIDEVHMLTNSAWNALLKTLEEPPAHVKFLFATTEAHKILPTVISRCQRFDLRPIPERLIAARLGEIAAKEGVAVTKGALSAIARAADGGMRDALSLLDQMIAFHLADDKPCVEEQDVLSTFALTDAREMDKLARAALANDARAAVMCVHRLADSGKNLVSLFNDLLEFLRGVELTLILDDPGAVLGVGDDTLAMYREAAAGARLPCVQTLLESLSTQGNALNNALNKRVFVETALLKAMRAANAPRAEDVLAKLNELRGRGELHALDKIPSTAIHPAPSRHPAPARPREGAGAPPPAAAQPARRQPSAPRGWQPQELWHRLIVEMDQHHVNKPLLKAYMQEGLPESYEGGVLRVVYDEEFGRHNAEQVASHGELLAKCLHRITGVSGARVDVRCVRGVMPAKEAKAIRDVRDVRRKAESSPFVRKVLELFEGRVEHVRG